MANNFARAIHPGADCLKHLETQHQCPDNINSQEIEKVEKFLARAKKIQSLKEAKFIDSIDYCKLFDLKWKLS